MRLFEKIFNVSAHEVPRTVYAWTLLFLHRLGLIIGTTTLTAMFVSQFGINLLPLMILLQALLTIAGMAVFSFLSDRFSSKTLIPVCAFLAGILLFISTFFVDKPYVFFGLILGVTGVFLPQLTIFLSNYIEDFFTPLECERTFPVIESAQTVGGIIAGVIIATLSASIGSYKFYYLWILFLFLVVTVIFFLEPFSSEHHHIYQKQEQFKRSIGSRLKKFRESIHEIQLVPFLQGMLIIFLLHWIIAHVLEFQYTKLIDESIAFTQGASHEESLVQGLGSFQILFHASALFVQLLVASRIFRKVGTVGSFLLHGLVTFFSSLSLLLGFGYFTVILAKNNFELSGIVHKNAYEASYYALRYGSQRQVREFFEAFIYPAGTILGTLIILGVQFFFFSEHAFFVLQVILVALAIGMVVFSLRLQETFTRLSKDNLLKSNHHVTKLHAIEILSQSGHRNHLSVLIQTLKNPRESVEVKVKILDVFHKLSDPKTIPVLIDSLHSNDNVIVAAAVHALGGFTKLGENIFEQAFSSYSVIKELKYLFTLTSCEKIQENIVRTLAVLRYERIVPFLLKVMKPSSEKFYIACIQVCSLFDDPALADYLLPGLKSNSPFVRAQTILALWKFPAYHHKLKSLLNGLFHSTKREDFLAYCSIIGDLGDKNDLKKLLSHFNVLDPVLKITIAFALLKLGYNRSAPVLVHLLFSRNSLVLEKARDLFNTLKPDKKKFLQNIVKREVSQRLQPLFSNIRSEVILEDNEIVLQRCKDVYTVIGLKNEVEQIHAVFESQTSPLALSF